MCLDFKCEISSHLTKLSDYYDQFSHIVLQLVCAKNPFVLAAGCVNTMNLFVLGDSCQNF